MSHKTTHKQHTDNKLVPTHKHTHTHTTRLNNIGTLLLVVMLIKKEQYCVKHISYSST